MSLNCRLHCSLHRGSSILFLLFISALFINRHLQPTPSASRSTSETIPTLMSRWPGCCCRTSVRGSAALTKMPRAYIPWLAKCVMWEGWFENLWQLLLLHTCARLLSFDQDARSVFTIACKLCDVRGMVWKLVAAAVAAQVCKAL